jgi:O-antigen ligase
MWILPIAGIGFGISLSIFGNVVFGTLVVGTDQVISIVRAVYWLLVCLITIALISNLKPQHINVLIMVLSISIIAVGTLRLYEAVAFNRIGAGTSRILTQNTYGIIFSTFTPFAIITLFMQKTARKWLFAIGIVVLILGIAVNGSRSSWVASGIGVGILGLLMIIAQKRRISSITSLSIGIFIIGIGIVSYLPPEVFEPISARFATLERYNADESYLTRVLMQQKALILFEQNPIFGVGRGQFRESYVELDLDGTLFRVGEITNINRLASHNSYAQFIAEQGLVGSVPLALLLLLLFVNGVRATIHLASKGEIWAVAIFAAFTAMSVHMWTIDNFQNTSSWFIYGLVAAMIEYEKRSVIELTRKL